MATITQLMEGKTPGSVKVRREGWGPGERFVPYFRNYTEDWYGLLNTDSSDAIALRYEEYEDWVLYIEPKRKVAMYLWVVKTEVNDIVHATLNYYTTEEYLRELNPDITWCQRLDYTKIEVEEDV